MSNGIVWEDGGGGGDDGDDDENLREEVLPLLLDIGSPQSSFPIYSVVFHEVYYTQNTQHRKY